MDRELNQKLTKIANHCLIETPGDIYDQAVQQVQAYIDVVTKSLQKATKKNSTTRQFDVATIHPKYKFTIIPYIEIEKQYCVKVATYLVNFQLQLLSVCNEMMNYLAVRRTCHYNISLFKKKAKECLMSDISYRHNKRVDSYLVRAIRRSLGTNSNWLHLLQDEFPFAVARFIQRPCYSPPSPFDDIFETWLSETKLHNMIAAAAHLIIVGNAEAAIPIITEFHHMICDELNIRARIPRIITFTSLIRILFNAAYGAQSIQNFFPEENCAFVSKCQTYSEQTVKELELSSFITQIYTQGLTVRSMFKSKQLDVLESMQYCTNPIDQMYVIHFVLAELATDFAGQESFISFDDTMTLLLAALSLSPPSNSVSMAVFAEKWVKILPSNALTISKNYFTASIEHLLGLDINDLVP